MVYFMENPSKKMDDDWGYFYVQEPPYCFRNSMLLARWHDLFEEAELQIAMREMVRDQFAGHAVTHAVLYVTRWDFPRSEQWPMASTKKKILRNCDFKKWFPDCFQLPAAEAVLLTITDVAEERSVRQ